MALRAKSALIYGIEIDLTNKWIDFKSASLGPVLSAELSIGFYTVTQYLEEVERAMTVADPLNVYTATINRNIDDGLGNRVTYLTSGTFLSFLFNSGPNAADSAHLEMGFASSADLTGSTSYTNDLTLGIYLEPELVGYNYLPQQLNKKVNGAIAISTSGIKEALVYQIQRFIEVQFNNEPEDKAITEWEAFFEWSIQQKPFEFVPQITDPDTFYQVTMETTSADGQALGYRMTEMLPDFPFEYTTGPLKMRLVEDT